ncbi:MAG: hypothetical protein RI842_00435 [Schleiferiaceae bacterium]|nr:hypothetical protein [Schleiferiaceae bacterium]MDR9441159.1 hypothetical protein [Schleiferiaceae bacterium]
MKNVFWAGLLVIGLAACQNKPGGQGDAQKSDTPSVEQSQIDSLKKAVLSAHDRVMPQMNPMGRLRNRLQEAAGEQPADSSQYRQAAKALAQAQAQMKRWMRQFRLPEDSSAAFQERYLKDQYQVMRGIENRTETAMKQARQLLNSADTAQTAP